MAPERNPPDLLNFLEKVFSCGPRDKEGGIRAKIPEIQEKRRDIPLAALRVEQRIRRRGDKLGTCRNQEEFTALNALKIMKNPPGRESRPAPNLNREAPQSSIFFWASSVSKGFIKLFTGKNEENKTSGLLPPEPIQPPIVWPRDDLDDEDNLTSADFGIPSSSPQTTGSGESFLSSIFCCSPRRK